MEQYDKNVQIIMDFLKEEKYSPSVTSIHRLCYREFRLYLLQEDRSYSFMEANKWVDTNKEAWNYRHYTGWRHCITQLNDVYQSGVVSLAHMGPHASAYLLLLPLLKEEVDEYLTYGSIRPDDERYRIHCLRFMFYLQEKRLTSIRQLDYDTLLAFHEEDYHKSSKSKDIYEDLIRSFLRYHASVGHCAYGLALTLNKMLIHKIIRIEQTELIEPLSQEGYSINWHDIELFLASMRETSYAGSVLKYSRHTLTLLFLFTDMHHLLVNEVIL